MCRLSLVVVRRGYSLVAVRSFSFGGFLVMQHGLQGTQASAVADPGLYSTGSIAVVHRLTCSMSMWMAGGFFTTDHQRDPIFFQNISNLTWSFTHPVAGKSDLEHVPYLQ